MSTSLLVFIVATITFFLLLSFLVYESKRGERLLAKKPRLFLDKTGLYLANKITDFSLAISRFIFGLTLRRLVHICLRTILSTIAHFYERLVGYFEYNYQKTNSLKKEKKAWKQGDFTYLGQLSEHQKQSQLSEKEKRKRKEDALEG